MDRVYVQRLSDGSARRRACAACDFSELQEPDSALELPTRVNALREPARASARHPNVSAAFNSVAGEIQVVRIIEAGPDSAATRTGLDKKGQAFPDPEDS